MTETYERIFRPNGSLESTLRHALRQDGAGLFERWAISGKVRRAPDDQRKAIELKLGQMVQDAVAEGTLTLPPQTEYESGIIVTGWQDLFAWFLENLPAILDMIMTIMNLFNAGYSFDQVCTMTGSTA